MVDAIYLADSPDTAWAEWYRWLAESAPAVVAPIAARERGAVLCIFWPPAPDVQVSHGSHERTVEPPAPPRGLRT